MGAACPDKENYVPDRPTKHLRFVACERQSWLDTQSLLQAASIRSGSYRRLQPSSAITQAMPRVASSLADADGFMLESDCSIRRT